MYSSFQHPRPRLPLTALQPSPSPLPTPSPSPSPSRYKLDELPVVMPPPSERDSTISVTPTTTTATTTTTTTTATTTTTETATTTTTKASRKRDRSTSPQDESPASKRPSNSPRLVPSAYTDLSPEQQAAIHAENLSAVTQAQAGIEIDDTSSDAGYETDSMGSSSSSLTSCVRDYAFENGRRYHKFREGTYNFPNDDSEQEREDMKHAMIVNLMGQRLHFAPIGHNPQNVLDIGTGTGIWAIEMGDLYPSSRILGVDLSPIQPEWVPPNVKFTVDDVESPWLKPENYYDYIHSRHTVMAIRNWPALIRTVLRHLKPGGWFELQEIHHYPQCHDGSMPSNHPVTRFWDLIVKALGELGININLTLLLEDMLKKAGFVNVTVMVFHVPIGPWPKNKVLKKVGTYWRQILIDGLQPIALGPMTRGLRWSREEVENWLVEVKNAYMDHWVHSHMPLYIIYAQRPEEGVSYSDPA